MTKLHIVGWKQCPYHQRAIKYANNNIKNILQIDQRTYNTRDEYREWLLKSDDHKSIIRKLKGDSIAAKHVTSPFVFVSISKLERNLQACGLIRQRSSASALNEFFCAFSGSIRLSTPLFLLLMNSRRYNFTFDNQHQKLSLHKCHF